MAHRARGPDQLGSAAEERARARGGDSNNGVAALDRRSRIEGVVLGSHDGSRLSRQRRFIYLHRPFDDHTVGRNQIPHLDASSISRNELARRHLPPAPVAAHPCAHSQAAAKQVQSRVGAALLRAPDDGTEQQ